ncbi:hypothetical protein ACFL6X_08700 [Candidatus Latescibacterota bacterium]
MARRGGRWRHCGWGLLGTLLLTSQAQAHEHWIDLDSFYPEVGTEAVLYLRSGHYFPKTILKLSEKVLQGVVARLPDDQILPVVVEEAEHQWQGVVGPLEHGVHVIAFSLKRPRAGEPNYEGKAILVAGSTGDAPEAYIFGSGLELLPGAPVSPLRAGDQLPLSLTLEGIRMSGELAVVPEDGRGSTVRTSPDQPAVVTLRNAGRYLVTASVKGRGCSLVFQVREAEEGAQ